MKKTKMLIVTALAFLASQTSSVYAKLPGNTIIISSTTNVNNTKTVNTNAYDLNCLFDIDFLKDINTDLNTGSDLKMYYIDNSNNPKIVDIFTNQQVQEGNLPGVTSGTGDTTINYKSAIYRGGVPYTLKNGEYSFYEKPTVKFSVTLKSSIRNSYIFEIKYGNGFHDSDYDSNKLESEGNTVSKIKIDGADLSFSKNETKTITYITNSKKIPITVYNNGTEDKELAAGELDLSTLKIGQATDVNVTLAKVIDPSSNLGVQTNSLGNIQNTGEVAYDDNENGYIYYINSVDRGKLYKRNLDGSENKLISEDSVKYMCVKKDVSETWIYYSNLSDGGKLYKVKSDGTGRAKISDFPVSYIAASTSELYFINSADSAIYYVGSDNSPKLLQGNNGTSIKAKNISVIGDVLYFSNVGDSNALYKYSSGTSTTKVTDDIGINKAGIKNIEKFIGTDVKSLIYSASDGYVYKRTTEDGKIKSERVTINLYNSITHTSREDKVSSINVIGNYIYYKSLNDGGKLYRVGIDGGNSELVVASSIDNIYVVNPDTLYYSQSGRMNRVDISTDRLGKTTYTVSQPQKDNSPRIIKYANSLSGTDEPQVSYSSLNVALADNTSKSVPVYWDMNKPIYNEDSTVYNGVILGGYPIKYTQTKASDGISDNNLYTAKAVNNPGSRDSITIKETENTPTIKAGDTIKVYNDSSAGTLLGQGVASEDGTVTISNIDIGALLNPISSYIQDIDLYISRKEKGKIESLSRKKITAKAYSPSIISTSDNDSRYNGLDGRDISITFNSLPGGITNKYVYILPKGRTLDLNSPPSIKYDLDDTSYWGVSGNTYTGTDKIKTDSLGLPLTSEMYIYLVGESSDGDKYSSEGKKISLSSETAISGIDISVIGDKFKAQKALSSVKVKLSGKATGGITTGDIANNYNINLVRNGLTTESYDIVAESNTIVLKQDYVNTLPVGKNEFTLVLTDKKNGTTIETKFTVVVNSAADFNLLPSQNKFTAGYAPEAGINIGITGTMEDGTTLTSIGKEDVIVSVKGTPITNFEVKSDTVSGNNNHPVITLDKDYLNNLTPDEYDIKVEDSNIGLSKTFTLTIVGSQAELTPVINNLTPFKAGHADRDIEVTLNAKDTTGKDVEFSGTEGITIKYEGTTVDNSNRDRYELKDGKTLTLKKKFLDELLYSDDNKLTITGQIKGSQDAGGILSGILVIPVKSAARLEFAEINQQPLTVIKGSEKDLILWVSQYDSNNKKLQSITIDLNKAKLKRGSNTLEPEKDYKILSNSILLKSDFLKELLTGKTEIQASYELEDGSKLSGIIEVTVQNADTDN